MKRFLEFILESDFDIHSLDYDQNYGKSFRFAYTPKDQSGTFSMLTPSNAGAWKSWKPVSSQDGEMLKNEFLKHQKAGTLNQFLAPHKVKQIAKHAIISENWSEATPDQQRFASKKFVYHVTTRERAEKIKKTGLKPSKKSKGKFKGLPSQKTPSSFVTSSRGLDYWTNAVAKSLNVGEEGITVLKYPVVCQASICSPWLYSSSGSKAKEQRHARSQEVWL